jgi:hypothetical protein
MRDSKKTVPVRDPASSRKDSASDRWRHSGERGSITKAELIEQHAELKKKLQSLRKQREAAMEEVAQLEAQIRQLQEPSDDAE